MASQREEDVVVMAAGLEADQGGVSSVSSASTHRVRVVRCEIQSERP